MEKSSIVSIYRSLDKSEQRELGKWVHSPVHNHRQDVMDLHHYLLAGNHLQSASALTKKRVWRKLFGKEAYDDARIRQTIHFATKVTEEWLAYREWQRDKVKKRLALAGQFRRRKLRKPLSKALKQLEKQQLDYAYRNEHFFRNEYLLQLEHYTNRGKQQRTQKDVKLQAVAAALDKAYLIEKLRLCCNMLFHQRVSKTPYDIEMLEPILAHVKQLDLEATPALAIYYYVIQTIRTTDDDEQGDYFSSLRTVIRTHGHLLPRQEQHDVYIMAINLCIPKLNAGIRFYLREAFEWWKLGFENGVLIENKQLSRYSFLNAAFIALNLGELDWTEDFIDNYQQYLSEEHREQAAGFARARLYYTKRDYAATMRLLAQMDFKDHVHNLISKYILLKIYYEEEEFDALESLLDSLSAYLRRKEIVEGQKVNGKNIIRLTRGLLRLNPYDKEKRKALKAEIENTNPLTERKWFLEMIDK